MLYENLTEPFTLFIEDSQRPEILVRGVPEEIFEGSAMKLQVALATPPAEGVNVMLGLEWISGEERPLEASSMDVSFEAGEVYVWKDVEIFLAGTEPFLGNSTLEIKATSFSESIVYDSSHPLGVPSKTFDVLVKDTGDIGVCLGPGKCRKITKRDFKFDGIDDMLVNTPYEVKNGEVRPLSRLLRVCLRTLHPALPFAQWLQWRCLLMTEMGCSCLQVGLDFILGTMPMDDVDLQFTATLENGIAEVYDALGEDTGQGDVAILQVNTSNWFTAHTLRLEVSQRERQGFDIPVMSDAVCPKQPRRATTHMKANLNNSICSSVSLQAFINVTESLDHVVVVTCRAISPMDRFYDGITFSFTVYISPELKSEPKTVVVPRTYTNTTEVRQTCQHCVPYCSRSVKRGLSSRLKHVPALPFRFVRCLRSAALSVPRQIETEDGVVLVFQAGSLPPATEITIVDVRNEELDCSLDATRFVPFGYKDILFSPPLPAPSTPRRESIGK